ncbi:hypothetical protein ACEYYB_14105 [Paracoccus sp. p4-l81]|uniref:hypothetical protein n=1 Tax=unclassified Paracoccus (in: a-proteobacteria) TaxID=2688777 RepID=UPI0035B9C0BD
MKYILVFASVACAGAAIWLAAYGIGVMYDDSYDNRIVGGDAYNYIIYAARGTAYVCAGGVAAVLSVFWLMLLKMLDQGGSQ